MEDALKSQLDTEQVTLEEVTSENTNWFLLVLEGHANDCCNGSYLYDGQENGKRQWSKYLGNGPPTCLTSSCDYCKNEDSAYKASTPASSSDCCQQRRGEVKSTVFWTGQAWVIAVDGSDPIVIQVSSELLDLPGLAPDSYKCSVAAAKVRF